MQKELSDWWEEQHKNNVRLWLSGYSKEQVVDFLELEEHLKVTDDMLNVGVGTGLCTREFFLFGINIDVLDICDEAIRKVSDVITTGYLKAEELPTNVYDLVVSHLVAQHISDEELLLQIICFLRALKPNGIIAMQFVDCEGAPRDYSVEAQRKGGVLRSKKEVENIISKTNGKILKWIGPKRFSHTPTIWYGVYIGK